jgi:hypothetical protein
MFKRCVTLQPQVYFHWRLSFLTRHPAGGRTNSAESGNVSLTITTRLGRSTERRPEDHLIGESQPSH